MTQQEIAAQKIKMYVLVVVGVVALIGSYAIGYFGPSDTRLTTMGSIVMTAIFFGCLFVAARMSFKQNKEGGSK
jgi:small neutral amino acid transporter SnatA (MarC family)